MEQTHGSAQEAVPTEWEQRVFALAGDGRSVRIDELETFVAGVRNSIAAERLRLTVVQDVWGIEFYVEMGRGTSGREGLYRAQ